MPADRPLGLRRAAPILPVGDLDAALAFYERLGFETSRYDAGYGYAQRERLILHLRASPEVDPRANPSAAWVDIADVDALHAEWIGLGLAVVDGDAARTIEPRGRISARVEAKPWGVREFAILDPDNNQLRFGTHDSDQLTRVAPEPRQREAGDRARPRQLARPARAPSGSRRPARSRRTERPRRARRTTGCRGRTSR